MEKSIDSIGSCSLDADLSTDFSDTSESCNFVSPSATRGDFTQGISERCRRTHQPLPLVPKIIMNQPAFENSSNVSRVTTTALFDVDSGKYYSSVDSQTKETSSETYTNGSSEKYLSSTLIDLQSPAAVAHANKKPSYLNLACCVNGYSNYTNYDSAERKEINKSREASPIPPFTSISRHSVIKRESPSSSLSITQRRFAEFNVQEKDTTDNASASLRTETKKSFIQQRVEKLYGTSNATNILTTTNNSHNNSQNGSKSFSPVAATVQQHDEQIDETSHALPVMKHLRPEFRSRLTFVSPPKSGNSSNSSNSKHIESPEKERQQTSAVSVSEKIGKVTAVHQPVVVVATVPVVPEKSVEQNNGSSNNMENGNSHEITTQTTTTIAAVATNSANVKDGHYFLKVLNVEKTRILSLADDAEQKLLQRQSEDNAPIPEEVVGLVLAAIGKARLLATKKFKQFEGLCHENINPNEDGPQTLADDLQGFWDMMMLQVDNIDESHKEVLQCIDNGWQKPQPPQPEPPKGARLVKRPLAQSNTNKSKSNTDAAQKREDQRKKLLELKRKQKAAMQTGEDELISMYNDKNEGSTDG